MPIYILLWKNGQWSKVWMDWLFCRCVRYVNVTFVPMLRWSIILKRPGPVLVSLLVHRELSSRQKVNITKLFHSQLAFSLVLNRVSNKGKIEFVIKDSIVVYIYILRHLLNIKCPLLRFQVLQILDEKYISKISGIKIHFKFRNNWPTFFFFWEY